MKIELKNEWDLTNTDKQQLNQLLNQCFKDVYGNREYYKQIPHYRLFAIISNQIIGHLGLDYRVMSLNDKAIRVLGIIDVCVASQNRGKDIASKLLKQAEDIARNKKLDFLLLFANNPRLYTKNGYENCFDNEIKWLKIHELKTLGVGTEIIEGFMFKKIGKIQWEAGTLDMLGYLY